VASLANVVHVFTPSPPEPTCNITLTSIDSLKALSAIHEDTDMSATSSSTPTTDLGAAVAGSPLLTIPAELRDIIYRFAMVEPRMRTVHVRTHTGLLNFEPSLLAICHPVKWEAG